MTAEPAPRRRTTGAEISRKLHAGAEAVASVAARAGDQGRIAEAYARRAAEGGAGRRMLAGFIGLEAPSNQRTADSFVRTVREQAGWSALARMWEDPDAFPSDTELSDPPAWTKRVGA